jgi:hypothetical protein
MLNVLLMKMLFKFILLTALRDKLYLGLFVILCGVFGLSNLVGFSALSEEAQMQLVYFAFLSRLVIVCGMILFICFYINKSFENKEVEFILARPISRNTLILSYWCSFTLITLILLIPVTIVIILYNRSLIGLLWWIVSVVLELMLVSTFAITASLILSSAVMSVLATASFYFISRMMGFFVYSVSIPSNMYSLNAFLKILSSIFPRLDLFGKTEWLVYGAINTQDICVILLQSLIYVPLMLFVAFHDFNKKQF